MIPIIEFKYHGELHHFNSYWLDLDTQQVWSEKTQRWMNTWKNRKGYVTLCLTDNNGKQLKSIKLSRLVWTIANGMQIPDGYDVNHIDENKENNAPTNLNLMTCKQNCNHGTRNARVAAAQSKAVAQLTLDGKLVAKWPSTMEAHRNGWNSGAVASCCNKCYMGTSPDVYKGYRWQWYEDYEAQA